MFSLLRPMPSQVFRHFYTYVIFLMPDEEKREGGRGV
jgi:hypothetical protein